MVSGGERMTRGASCNLEGGDGGGGQRWRGPHDGLGLGALTF